MLVLLRTKPQLIVPVLIAALLRVAHGIELAWHDPLFTKPVVDAWYHYSEAQRILELGWTLPGTGAFYKGPLYSYLLAVLLAFFGDPAAVVAGKCFNLALGVVSVGLCSELAERWAGVRAAWIAGLTAALYGTSIYYDATLLQPALIGALLVASLLYIDRAFARPVASTALVRAGIGLGLLAATRGEALLLIVLLAAWIGWANRSWRPPAILLTVSLSIVLPFTLRNTVLEHDPVVSSWNGGINLFLGNDPAFEQASGQWHPDLAWMRLYQAPALLGLTTGNEHQQFFVRQTWQRLVRDPIGWLRIVARKATLLVSGYEISNNQRIDEGRQHSWVIRTLVGRYGWLAWPFGLVFPLILAGVWQLRGRTTFGQQAALLMACGWALIPMLFFNTARYRLGAVVLLVPVAAAGWAQFDKTRRWGAIALALIAAVAAAITIPAAPTLPPSEPLQLADVAEREGDRESAARFRQRAVEQEPENPFALIRYADTLRVTGQCERAASFYQRVIDNPMLAADWRNAALRSMARCRAQQADWVGSEALFRRVLDSDPDRPFTTGRPDFHLEGTPPLVGCELRLDLAEVLARQRRQAEAITEIQRVAADCESSAIMSNRARTLLRQLQEAESFRATEPGTTAPRSHDR